MHRCSFLLLAQALLLPVTLASPVLRRSSALLPTSTTKALLASGVPTADGLNSSDSYAPNRYIIKIKKQYAGQAAAVEKIKSLIDRAGDTSAVGYVYDPRILCGLSATLAGNTYTAVASRPEVESVVVDSRMSVMPLWDVLVDTDGDSASTASSPNDGSASDASSSDDPSVLFQRNTAAWGLQRLSQREAMWTDPTRTNYSYAYRQPAGRHTVVYVLDTGARASHYDFAGRVQSVAQFGGYTLQDRHGHGTHCVGLVGGNRWGVAKNAQIKAIKVLGDNGSGATSDIIAGVQYVVDQYRASGYIPTVASLSLGGARNLALDEAITNAVEQGVHFAVAAGNSHEDACSTSPAAASAANTVGATDIDDYQAWYSNYGDCVDLYAPGSNITSTWWTSNRATARISGTSMATPYVAGVMAYYLSQRNMSTSDMSALLKQTATYGVVQSDEGEITESSDFLLYNSVN